MSTIAVNTQTIRQQTDLLAALEEELVVWAEDETSHSILYRKPGTEQSPVEAGSREEMAEETSDVGRGGSMRVKGRSHLHNIKV